MAPGYVSHTHIGKTFALICGFNQELCSLCLVPSPCHGPTRCSQNQNLTRRLQLHLQCEISYFMAACKGLTFQLNSSESHLGRARGEPSWPAPEATLSEPSCSSDDSSAAAAIPPAPAVRPRPPRHVISPSSAADPVSNRAAARVVLRRHCPCTWHVF